MNNTASLPLKVTPILAAHASFFLLPSGGGEEREKNANKQKRTKQTQTHHSHYSGINGIAMGLSTNLLYLQPLALCTRSASALQLLWLSLMLVVSSAYKTLLSKSVAE